MVGRGRIERETLHGAPATQLPCNRHYIKDGKEWLPSACLGHYFYLSLMDFLLDFYFPQDTISISPYSASMEESRTAPFFFLEVGQGYGQKEGSGR